MENLPLSELKNLAMEAGVKGHVKDIPFPIETIKEIEEIGKKYDRMPSRFMFYWLYLTGQRVSESLRLRIKDISFREEDGKKIMLVNSITLKNMNNPRRTIPILMHTGEEKGITDFIAEKLATRTDPDDMLFHFTRKTYWNKMSKVSIKVPSISVEDRSIKDIDLRIYPHYLRHCRATHMVSYHNYDLLKLMHYFGWASTAMPNLYVSFNWRKLVGL